MTGEECTIILRIENNTSILKAPTEKMKLIQNKNLVNLLFFYYKENYKIDKIMHRSFACLFVMNLMIKTMSSGKRFQKNK